LARHHRQAGVSRRLGQVQDLTKRYEALITTRFAADFAPGSLVDSNGLDQRLEEASFDLPVSLEVTIRSAGPRPTFTSP
jgi:hypothetical protein